MKMKLQLVIALCAVMLSSTAYSQQDFSKATEMVRNYLTTESNLAAKAGSLQFEVDQDATRLGGLRQIHALQQKDGIYIREGILQLTYDRNGKLYPMDEFVDPVVNTTVPAIAAETALRTSLNFHGFPNANVVQLEWKDEKKSADNHVTYDRGLIAASDLQSRLMYIQFRDEVQLRLTWETQLHTNDRQHYWVSYVDAVTGQVLETEDKVLHCSFGGAEFDNLTEESQAHERHAHHQRHMSSAKMWDKIETAKEVVKSLSPAYGEAPAAAFAIAHTYLVLDMPNEAPNDNTNGQAGQQQEVTTNGNPLASPFGWLSIGGADNLNTQGNNVWAFYDPSPGPLGGAPNPGAAASGTNEFKYEWDLSEEPGFQSGASFPNRDAAIVNLFYWNNLMHDVFYHFGFTEDGRNFQNNQNGRHSGIAPATNPDELLAQAQDGGGVNNANMLTLADGTNGQMQMYLWTASTLAKLVEIKTVTANDLIVAGERFESVEAALYADHNAMTAKLSNNPIQDTDFAILGAGCGGVTGCGTYTVPCDGGVTDKIALIDRGDCSFVQKVYNAQQGGAVGAIVMNNNQADPNAIIAMGGTDPEINLITIPTVMVSFNTGLKLKAVINDGGTINGDMEPDPSAPPGVMRDGDFDNGVIAHEYGHGISIRTSMQTATGGSLSGSDEQGGEGWADYYALFMTTTDSDLDKSPEALAKHPNGMLPPRGIGSYVRYQDYTDGAGIRPRRYSPDMEINPFTYTGSANGGLGVTSSEITIPHGIGFIWCTMEYDLTQKMIDLYGMKDDKYVAPDGVDCVTGTCPVEVGGFNTALMLINTGIAMQAASPKFTDMRDGILRADEALFGGLHKCDIWEVFARRGVGFGTDAGTDSVGDETESFATHPDCNPAQVFYSIDKSAPSGIDNGGKITYTINVTNTSPTDTPAEGVVVTDVLAAGTTFSAATGAPFNLANNVLTWTIPAIAAGVTVPLTVTVDVNTPTGATIQNAFDFEGNNGDWVGTVGTTNVWTLRSDNDGHEGSSGYFFCANNNNNEPVSYLTYTGSALDFSVMGKQLRFWHKYDTDTGYDGGFVETTSDGTTWTRMTLQENPYNGALNSTFNPVNAGAAYTGKKDDYIESAGMIPDDATGLRFVLSEDAGGGSGVGWWVDDIRIVTNPVRVTNVVSVTDPINDGGRTKTAEASTLVVGESGNEGLAVELLDLTATAQEKAIELNWETASESDNAGFYVERQAKGETEFTELGFVAGQNQAAKYNYLDETAQANVLYTYRLRQLDYAAKASYSNLVSALIKRAGTTVTINPNPATSYTEVSLENVKGGQLNLLSTDGRLIRSYPVENTTFQRVRLELNDLAKGVYLIQYKNGTEQVVDRIIVK